MTDKPRSSGRAKGARRVVAAPPAVCLEDIDEEAGAKPSRRGEAEKRLKQAELLASVSRQVAGIETLDEALETIVQVLTQETGAERGTLFLNDPKSGELYSRVAQGNFHRELRIANDSGIAGSVFTSGAGLIVPDAYAHELFDPSVDELTGFKTKSICCAPVATVKGEVIGVVQVLNKRKGDFTRRDLELLEAITTQAAFVLKSTQFVERMQQRRDQEMKFLDMVSDITAELDLGSLLFRVMEEARRMLRADRATLFLNDEKSQELISRIAMDDSAGKIRVPNDKGIAGAVFTSGKSINIPHAYADLRFNPAFDKATGYFTRSILCVPVVNKAGKILGVTQALNRQGGPFTEEDETRLKAFTAQVAVALENAKLFDDVQNMKNYNEGMLQSMSNGVLTVDENDRIVTCNAAGLHILRSQLEDLAGKPVEDCFSGPNDWVMSRLRKMQETQTLEIIMDQEMVFGEETISVNANFLPLLNAEGEKLGSMIMFEDMTSEKRMKATMTRYMDPSVADQLLDGGESLLGGKSMVATVLFSDIRSFTTITEALGPQDTVAMLNEYFTIMVECITREEGMLDKFIGDAIMAGFGLPLPHDDDADRGLRAAIAMQREGEAWNVKRLAEGKPEIRMGIGLNSDTIVSGNIGSPKRMDYTMIGDGVNLAARIESACKQYSAQILISEFTFERLKGTYRLRDVDKVIVKGKTEPVRIFEALDHYTEETFPNLIECVDHFKSGREYYNRGDWDKSIKAFEEALALNPGDTLAATYIDRNKKLRAKRPKEWNGVWTMTTK